MSRPRSQFPRDPTWREIEVKFHHSAQVNGQAIYSGRFKANLLRGMDCSPRQTIGQAANHANVGNLPGGVENHTKGDRSR